MWRISAMAMGPRSGTRAGMRRCLRDTSTRAFSASASATTTTTTISHQSLSYPQRTLSQNKNHHHRQYRRSRYFHTTTSIAANASASANPNPEPEWGSLDIDGLDDMDPNNIPDNNNNYEDIDESEYGDDAERERYRLQQEKVNAELDSRTGRPWRDPWEIKEEQWMSSDTSSENLPDWSPAFVSRISLERLQVLPIEDGGGVPTLQTIAEMSLPGSNPVLHPSRKTKTYAAYRKSRHYAEVKACVEILAKDRVAALLKEASSSATNANGNGNGDGADDAWGARQDAVDALFENLQEEAKADASMDILAKHPAFPSWVDRGLEEYLRTVEKEALLGSKSKSESESESNEANESNEVSTAAASGSEEKKEGGEADVDTEPPAASFRDETPVFMDCYDPSEAHPDGSSTGPMVPGILTPLGPHRHGGPGRMVEEWELSAHATTKRIMLRECTQQIAGLLSANAETEASSEAAAPKIYVHGNQGVGKTAVLASIVASARKSGHIVLYLPDGDRLRKNGYFITPSTHPGREGMFDLQDLSQEALKQLVDYDNASTQMEGMVADKATLELYFKDTQFKRLDEYRAGLKGAKNNDNSDGDGNGDDGSISLLDLIGYSQEHKKHAPMCYSVVVNRLMHQTDKKFMIVMDEFNCLFDKGHYFHMAYDEDVSEAIPHDKINLFEPIIAAMDISTKTIEDEEDEVSEVGIKSASGSGSGSSSDSGSTFATAHTAVVVGTSECHGVPSGITSGLTECALRRPAVTTIEVPRFSSLEADHVLANFEATGVGKLRLDRGDTLMNPQEMEFLKMASGSIGQKLLDVSIF